MRNYFPDFALLACFILKSRFLYDYHINFIYCFCFCRKPNPLISFPTYPNGGLHGICNEFPFRFRT